MATPPKMRCKEYERQPPDGYVRPDLPVRRIPTPF
jgi:hypothetical protein